MLLFYELNIMGAKLLIIMSALIICKIDQVLALSPPTAQLNNSLFIGQTVNYASIPVHQFVGIPFAEPPVGDLRFRKPVPIESYPEEFQATVFPKACPQYTIYPYPWYIDIQNRPSEDCLYLNIWVPSGASRFNRKAVMYWMYGGGDRYGSLADPHYNGTVLAALGDIIVVTMNYRMNYFGFFTSNTTDAPGNLGIWDSLEGLKWVNNHIAAFGGDVSRITIAGQSSGAVHVGLLTISPLAKGLYARQIMESTSPAYRLLDNNTQSIMYSQLLAKTVGCASDTKTIYNSPTEVVDCLRGVDADTIMRLEFDFGPDVLSYISPGFGDEILPENPRISVINDNFRCSNLLIGNVKDEGSVILTGFQYKDYFGFYGEKNPRVNRSFGQNIIRAAVSAFPDPEAIVNYYLPSDVQYDTDYRIRAQAYTALGDTLLLCPTVYYAEKCEEQNKDVYFYFFTHRPSTSPWAHWLGTAHFDEVPFVFGRPVLNSTYDVNESILSKQIIEIWSSFVKNGKPSISWPKYNKETRRFKVLGPDIETRENGPHKRNCDFLKPYFGF